MILNRNRSSCDSGSGKMPSCSYGFWVAITRNGSGRGCVRPSTVTVRSCIASSSDACVRGGVRLISSARRMFVNTAPGMKTFSPIFTVLTPVISSGEVSGVNWMRLNWAPSTWAMARQSSVFALPGGPSIKTCPRANAATSSSSTASPWPMTTLPTSSRARSRRLSRFSYGRAVTCDMLPSRIDPSVVRYFRFDGLSPPPARSAESIIYFSNRPSANGTCAATLVARPLTGRPIRSTSAAIQADLSRAGFCGYNERSRNDIRGRPGFDVVDSPVELRAEVPGRPR